MAFIGRYEFGYTTPTPGTDDSGNPVTVQVPTVFAPGGISDDVAKRIRFGLRKVPSITNVTAERVMENKENVTGDPY